MSATPVEEVTDELDDLVVENSSKTPAADEEEDSR